MKNKIFTVAVEDEPEQKFLGFIPVQVGPSSEYARRVRKWMQAVLLIQIVACCVRIFFIKDFAGASWMLLMCCFGGYAISQDMNITYVCVWGLACLFSGIFDTVALVLPLVLDLVTLSWVMIPVRASVPACELLGAAFAWHLYHDYYVTGGGARGKDAQQVGFEGLPDPMAKLVDGGDPETYGAALFSGFKARGAELKDKFAKGGETFQQQAKHGGDVFLQQAEGLERGAKDAAAAMAKAAPEFEDKDAEPEKKEEEPERSPFSTHPEQPRVLRKQAPCC